MDFARLVEQAKDLWSRPVGKWLFGGLAVFIVSAAVLSYMWSRPVYVALGRFDAQDAPAVAKKLTESKIQYKNDANFNFTVRQDHLEQAKLVLAELPNLDSTGAVWAPDTWRGKTSWSDTELDKRRLWQEQTETNLTRAIRALSVVEQARVQISVPMEKPLFKADEKPPKATVVILPKRGQELSIPVVESVMELVAGAVEGLDKKDVVVMDAGKSRVVSTDAFRPKPAVGVTPDGTSLQSQVEKQFQDRWTEVLTQQLEKVAGVGKVSVIVNPTFNWARVMEEVQEYKPGANGKGVVLSEQTKRASADGTSAGAQGPNSTGTTPNAEAGIPGYPGAVNQPGGGNLSQESAESVVNYLVSQTKRITENTGGSIEEISVGIMVDNKTVDAAAETAMKTVVTTAMGSKAQVEVAALPFAPSLWDTLGNEPAANPTPTGMPNLLYVLLAVALTLGMVGFAMLAFRPRKPVLESVFAGPEAVMMGGIPVADLDMPANQMAPPATMVVDAYAAQMAGQPTAAAQQPEEEAVPLAPEEIALLGDDFLQKLGVDPTKVRMREKVEKIAKANPDAVAQLLKTWIQDG